MSFIPWAKSQKVETLERHVLDLESELHSVKLDLKSIQENYDKLNEMILTTLKDQNPKGKPGRKPKVSV